MKINRQELITALEATRPGLAAKEIVEQSTAFVFREGRVYAYNDMIAVSHPCPKDLAGAVCSNELYKLLARSTDDELDVETTADEIIIKGKRNKAGISLQAVITLPIDEIGVKKVWKTLPTGFTEAVKFTLFSAGDDMTRPAMTGVHITESIVETCDNFRLTRWTLGKRDRFDGDLLLPAAACAELVRYMPTHYALTDGWAHFTNKAGAEFGCRTIAGEFPDLLPFVNREWKHEIEFASDTADILDRAAVFLLGDKTVHPMVTVKVSSGRMTISVKGVAGWFEETVRVTASKDGFEFVIDPQALKDMLPLLKDCKLSADGSVLKFEGEAFIHCCATVQE